MLSLYIALGRLLTTIEPPSLNDRDHLRVFASKQEHLVRSWLSPEQLIARATNEPVHDRFSESTYPKRTLLPGTNRDIALRVRRWPSDLKMEKLVS